MKNKIIIVGCLTLFSWSCGNQGIKDSQNKREKKPTYDREEVRKKIESLVDAKKFPQAIDFLDSLIKMNSKDGYLFYEKGYTEGANFHAEAAIKDFKTAESFNYDKEKCERMIRGAQIIIKYGVKQM